MLVGGPGTHLLSLILLLITVMCVITEKKLLLNIARLCCHNFLSLVVFWLGGPGPPGPPPPGYAYGPDWCWRWWTFTTPNHIKNPNNNQENEKIVREDRRLSIRLIAERMSIDKETVRQALNENLHMTKVCAQVVSKLLTSDQKEKTPRDLRWHFKPNWRKP